MKRAIAILVPLLIIGSLVVWRIIEKRSTEAAMVAQRQARTNAAAKVTVAVAEIRDIANTFEATGTLEAPLNVKISSKITGRIETLTVHEGDRISKGQVLVRVDASQVEADVRQAQAALSEAQYRLAQTQITENPMNVGVETQIRQQAASVASAQADYDQVRENREAQIAVAESSVTDAQGRVDNTQAAIGNAQAAISSANANLNNARIKYGRIADLQKQGFVAAQDVDDAKATVAVQEAAVEVAQGQLKSATAARDSANAQRKSAEHQVNIQRTKLGADVEAARQKLAQAKASLDYARSNTAQAPAYKRSIAALSSAVEVARGALDSAKARRADTVLRSPLDGYVTGRMMDPGAVATAGQPILAVQFFQQMWVSVAVPDSVSAKAHIGQSVAVTFDAMPGKTFTAGIIQVNPSADPQARQFTVRAVLSNTDNNLKPGMFAHVLITTDQASGVLAVPREAIQQDDTGSYVTMVDEANKAHRVTVTTGLSDAAYISVLSGLQEGDRVVTVASVPLKDDQKVNPGQQAEATGAPGAAAATNAPGAGDPAAHGAPAASGAEAKGARQ
jgi:HlyD family secretion protein